MSDITKKGAHELVDLVRDVFEQKDVEENKTATCEIESVNEDNTLNVYVLPDKINVIRNVTNQCRYDFKPGDQATVFLIRNKTNNSFIIAKHNTRGEYGGAKPITIDKSLSYTSENPVQNKVIAKALLTKQNVLVSGQNIATINGRSLLSGGDIAVTGMGTIASGTGIDVVQNSSNDFTINLKTATNDSIGGVKIGYSGSDKNYAVELDNDQAYVYVPWEDTTYSVVAGSSGTGNSGLIKLSGTTVSTQTQSTKFMREDGTWAAPSYTVNSNTWRNIKLDNVQKLGTGTTSGALNIVTGNYMSIEYSNTGNFKFSVDATSSLDETKPVLATAVKTYLTNNYVGITDVATELNLGLIKLGSSTPQTEPAQTASTVVGRTYPIQLNSTNKAVVNVPWVAYGVSSYDTLGLIKLGSNTVQTQVAQAPSSIQNRTYPIQLDNSNHAVVNVPWEKEESYSIMLTWVLSSSTSVGLYSINLTGLTYIDWGDGTTNSTATHIYSAGTYYCKIYGVYSIGGAGSPIVETGASYIEEVIISDLVTNINMNSLYGLSGLKKLTIPFVGQKIKTSSETYQYPLGWIFGLLSYTGSTGTMQYYYGSNTSSPTNTTYYIPTSLKTVIVTGGNILLGAFYGCGNLTNITLPNNITSIENMAFLGCSSLMSITIPEGVTNMGDSIFSGCSSLQNITIPDSVTDMGYGVFYGCSGLIGITIPNNITNLKSMTFYNCNGLLSITIYNTLIQISSYAFYGCSSLSKVYYFGTQAQYNSYLSPNIGNNNTPFVDATKYYLGYSTTVSGELTLNSTSWDSSNNYSYTLAGATSSDTVILSPKTRADQTNANTANLFCVVATNALNFNAVNTPTQNITFLYTKFGG